MESSEGKWEERREGGSERGSDRRVNKISEEKEEAGLLEEG